MGDVDRNRVLVVGAGPCGLRFAVMMIVTIQMMLTIPMMIVTIQDTNDDSGGDDIDNTIKFGIWSGLQ